MDRRRFLLRSLIGALAAPLAAEAQAGKVYRLGTLNLGTQPPAGTYDARRDVVEVLRGLGYVEGQNLEVERRYADGRVERLPALAAELVNRHVDVVVAGGTAAVRAAQEATRTIPIVVIIAGQDTVDLGLTPSLARPGGNVTGVTVNVGPEIEAKRLHMLKEAVPSASRIAFLGDKND